MLCSDIGERNYAVLAAYLVIGIILLTSVSYYQRVLAYADELEEKEKGAGKETKANG